MKLKLYLDFDGVILDTINVTYKQLEELNITEEEFGEGSERGR